MATANSLRCEDCPESMLEDYLASPRGQLIGATIDLDFAIQAGVTVSLQEILFPEFLMLRALSEERNRHQAEIMERKTSAPPRRPQRV